MTTTLAAALASALIFAAACSSQSEQQNTADVNADSAATPPALETGHRSGTDHGPGRDADREFLRTMSNHHEGLIQMAMEAMNKGAAVTTRADAQKLREKQAAERDQMINMLQASYDETHTALPKNVPHSGTLSRLTGAEYDKTFYRMVIAHHRESIQMIDDFLQWLTRAEVRQMAGKMRSDQQREIQEFQSEL